MATKKSRDARYTKTFGTKPHHGRRYVANDKVRIEWHESGKRRSRTIGPNSAFTRQEADAELQQILDRLGSTGEAAKSAAPADSETLESSLRTLALTFLDAADQVADGIRNAARELMGQIEADDEPPEKSDGRDGDTPGR